MADKTISDVAQNEATYGSLPTLNEERSYKFIDAFLVLSGYAIATWCYTQGIYMAQIGNFQQLVISDYCTNLFALAIYIIPPVLLASKWGIDIWIWLKSIFGTNGVKVMVVIIILVNFPWFGVCADIFGSSMLNMFHSLGIMIPDTQLTHILLGFVNVALGTWIALSGPTAIKITGYVIVPAMLIVGVVVCILGFRAVPMADLLAYEPDLSYYQFGGMEAYMASIEGSFGFAFSWALSTAVVPRLCKTERAGYWSTLAAYGVVSPTFVFAGGICAIATLIKFGTMGTDITLMMVQLGGTWMAILSLAMVAFANIGTHGTGAYMWTVVIKQAFPKASYKKLVLLLGAYTFLIVIWGKIIEYFGTMISVSAFAYGPIMAMLFIDFFVVRKKKLDLRSAYELEGHNCYRFTKGFNIVGFVCMVIGVIAAMYVYDVIGCVAKNQGFLFCAATGLACIVSGVLYYLCYKIPSIKKYMTPESRTEAA